VKITKMRLGFVVNPIAGMGGRVGLKGTDGVSDEAAKRGAKPVSPTRAEEFLEALKDVSKNEGKSFDIVTCRASMGEDELNAVGVEASRVLPIPHGKSRAGFGKTTSHDTKEAVKAFVRDFVETIIFVGGDGTARDVLTAIKDLESVQERPGNTVSSVKKSSPIQIPPVLGVPSGVKMYSAVFASNPVDAAQMISLFSDKKAKIAELEVVDVDENAFRNDQLSIHLYGYLPCLYVPLMSQTSKEVSSDTIDEIENQKAIAKAIVEDMDPDGLYILGPGTTVKTLAEMLNVKKTTLGVDLFYRGKTVAIDADEKTIIRELEKHEAKYTWIVVSPIGRQGMIFGRGNQQISPTIIKRVGKAHIIVVATKSKVRNLDGGFLKVDTGDKNADRILRGYVKVITDYREWRMLPVR
jgi:predicted polyphosphate/ATP-dependent NAD kinase